MPLITFQNERRDERLNHILERRRREREIVGTFYKFRGEIKVFWPPISVSAPSDVLRGRPPQAGRLRSWFSRRIPSRTSAKKTGSTPSPSRLTYLVRRRVAKLLAWVRTFAKFGLLLGTSTRSNPVVTRDFVIVRYDRLGRYPVASW